MSVKNILVIDDSMSSRLVLRKMLQQYDVDVSMFASVNEAMTALKTSKPDAVFLDRHMPGTSGLQALRMLKEDSATAAIPVVMFTSLGPGDDPETLLDAGALAILTKPFSDQALADIMEKLDSAQQHGGRLPAARKQTARDAKVDEAMLQPLIERVLEQTVRQQLMPHIEKRLTTIDRAVHDGRFGAAGETRIDDKIQTALRQTTASLTTSLTQKLGQRIDELQAEQQRLEQQLGALRQQIEQQPEERAAPVASPGSENDDDMQYYVMDSIVEENVHGDDAVWQTTEDSPNDAGRPTGRGRPGRRDRAVESFGGQDEGAAKPGFIGEPAEGGGAVRPRYGIGAERRGGRGYILAVALLLVAAVLMTLYFMRHF